MSIGEYAFSDNQLSSIVLPNNIKEFGDAVFWNNQIENVVIPEGIEFIGIGAFDNNKLTEVTIPSSVTKIGSSAFQGNELTSVTIPETVKSIGSYAFAQNKLTEVTVPDGIKSIENYTFAWNQLTNISIPDTVTFLGEAALTDNKLTNITISENVTALKRFSLSGNPFKEVTILSKNTVFDNNVFDYDTSKLTLKGYDNSTAQSYAKKLGITFESLDKEKEEINFSDVKQGPSGVGDHYEGIIYLAEKKIISGKGNGKFDPWAEATRGQIAKMITNALNLEIPKNINDTLAVYQDINPSSDNAKYIAAVTKAGVFKGTAIKGSDKRLFGEYTPIKREQMASVLVRAFKLGEIPNDNQIDVNVEKISPDHQEAVQTLANLGITTTPNDFKATQSISRAALSTFFYRAMEAK